MIPIWLAVAIVVAVALWVFNSYARPSSDSATRIANVVVVVILVWYLLSVLVRARGGSFWFPL